MPEPQPRLTPQRLAILEVVREATDHPTANDIFHRVRARHPSIAYGTVYSALRTLTNLGLIQELKFGDAASRYDGRLEPHHHAVCLGCGRFAEVEVSLTERQWSQVSRQTGFEIHGHHIQFAGYCPACSPKGGHEPQ